MELAPTMLSSGAIAGSAPSGLDGPSPAIAHTRILCIGLDIARVDGPCQVGEVGIIVVLVHNIVEQLTIGHCLCEIRNKL